MGPKQNNYDKNRWYDDEKNPEKKTTRLEKRKKRKSII